MWRQSCHHRRRGRITQQPELEPAFDRVHAGKSAQRPPQRPPRHEQNCTQALGERTSGDQRHCTWRISRK
ncbi:unnamed protein product [Peniophora sp. CBMAI 1063]|nr:unnamed protein product [Peniophora sp. CBMAI 1063]